MGFDLLLIVASVFAGWMSRWGYDVYVVQPRLRPTEMGIVNRIHDAIGKSHDGVMVARSYHRGYEMTFSCPGSVAPVVSLSLDLTRPKGREILGWFDGLPFTEMFAFSVDEVETAITRIKRYLSYHPQSVA